MLQFRQKLRQKLEFVGRIAARFKLHMKRGHNQIQGQTGLTHD